MSGIEVHWRCPACRGELRSHTSAVHCDACQTDYPVVLGVPDLRLQPFCDFDLAADRQRVESLLGDVETCTAETLVRRLFSQQSAVPENFVALRSNDVLQAPVRLERALLGALREYVAPDGTLLDLGCGPGQLVAGAARRKQSAMGIDISLEWLVVARRLIAEHGGQPVLAAACAEALPLPDGSIASILGLDVIEHVTDAALVVREAERVLRPGGQMVLTTPNRYSLTPEPHVFLWGVGWLPRRWQAAYVNWRTGDPYAHVHLRSSWGLLRLFDGAHGMHARIVLPPVSMDDARGSIRQQWLFDLYNRLIRFSLLRPLFLLHGPFFQVVAVRKAGTP